MWVDGCLLQKLYLLFILIILRFVFLSLPPSPHFFLRHHQLLFTACSLTLNPLSGCRTAGGEETVCENMYHVLPRALLLIYPAPRVHSPPNSSTKLRCVDSISASLFAIKTGIKGHFSTLFPSCHLSNTYHTVSEMTRFSLPPPPSLSLSLAIL